MSLPDDLDTALIENAELRRRLGRVLQRCDELTQENLGLRWALEAKNRAVAEEEKNS